MKGHMPSQPKPEAWGRPGMAIIKRQENTVSCSCGWMAFHTRGKVRDDKAQAHLDKRHGGKGLWL